jgi:hypothetical protein
VKKHTNKVIKPFKKYDVDVGIKNNPSMAKQISNDQMEEKDRGSPSSKKKHKRSKVNGDDKLWSYKHCNEEQDASFPAEQNFEIIKV